MRPTTHAQRSLIDDMAFVLVDQVPDLGSDADCMIALLKAKFDPEDICRDLDAARDLARAARASESELWWKLMNERVPE